MGSGENASRRRHEVHPEETLREIPPRRLTCAELGLSGPFLGRNQSAIGLGVAATLVLLGMWYASRSDIDSMHKRESYWVSLAGGGTAPAGQKKCARAR